MITILSLINVDTCPLSKTGRWVKVAEQEVRWISLWALLRNPYGERCYLPHFEHVRQTQHGYSDACLWDRVSHWPGTHHLGQIVGQARPRNPGFTSPELGLQALPHPRANNITSFQTCNDFFWESHPSLLKSSVSWVHASRQGQSLGDSQIYYLSHCLRNLEKYLLCSYPVTVWVKLAGFPL